ncbi:GMC oxidoreductase [Sinomicrobium weinanense]|uniref:GMC family oxidoreductase n=1 Tax=Sinomicrobium weinanense TaxID=2842200 RepID=A0A926Q334_9FLAO|nr:GMC family oxidoreductase [Sinomicrobium weinanense]MBC9796479.1 GMC family oxidoreductase [Sinomicrobium weinanense]MBU3125924.1 GMC family oxidoreductase [Sinomicrobium weinanense]
MYINKKGKDQNTYDAIIIGSGISGGWAAKELCEKGLKTLVLERGRMVEHIKDYPTAHMHLWEFPHRNRLPLKVIEENPVASRCYAFSEDTEHFFVKDKEHPYEQSKPFDWIRGYQVGGKSLLWARHTQRWSDLDFEANAKEGIAVDWPIRYRDIAPWYSYVEKFVGISGNRDGLPQLPDGEFLPPMEMNCLETYVKEMLSSHYKDRHLIISRMANLTVKHGERGPCQYRNLCRRGCPFGGYFSSNSSTLPAAQKTGNLTIRPHAVVDSIIYDQKKGKATGVRVIDANTQEATEYFAKIIFVNASTLNSTLILMNSRSDRFPDGMGNESGSLGHNLMDHNYNARVVGEFEGLKDSYYAGRRPAGIYMPRFRNFKEDKQPDFVRGYAYSGGGFRPSSTGNEQAVIGKALKKEMTGIGPWTFSMHGMGECLPYHENRISLHPEKTDSWGIPLLVVDAEYKKNERAMEKDMVQTAMEMLDKANFKNIRDLKEKRNFGLNIHEMGTARMGRDRKTSVLNRNNQVWGAENVFVTDGACMTSSGCQNPSLTYMALTARAADFAVRELNKRNL